MSGIDEKIREALKASRDSDELFEDKGVIAEVVAPFRGKRRWVNWVGIFYGLIANVVFVWAVVRIYLSDDAGEKVNWLLVGIVALMFVVFSKLYFWLEMHTNRVLQEVKRVELLLLQEREANKKRGS